MEMSMKDKVRPRGHFLEIEFSNGAGKAVAVGDIKIVTTRREGGCTIRLQNNHTILVGCSYSSVMRAVGMASEGGAHAATV
jgi:hypothetical protein